jgi:S1-C subfamily serine protease
MGRSRTNRWGLAAVRLAVLAFAIAGCGDHGEQTVAPPGSPAPEHLPVPDSVEAPQPSIAAPPATAPAVDAGPPEIPGSTRAVSDTEWEVTRAWLDATRRDPDAALGTVRLVPREEDGSIVGVITFGVRRSSPTAALGFQNGDLIRTINGVETRDIVSTPALLPPLLDADTVTVALIRRGLARTHTIRIVPQL